MRRLCLRLTLLSLVSAPALATKPCPPPPCFEGNERNEALCQQKASWVAVGRLTRVKHNRQPEPLFKDFATFTLVIERWEKGGAPAVKEVTFTVGWCHNGRQVPEDHSGLFRFYGATPPTVSGEQARYLDFVEVAPEKKP